MYVIVHVHVYMFARVHNYTEESIEHWNRSAENNVTSGGLHVIVHEEKRSS